MKKTGMSKALLVAGMICLSAAAASAAPEGKDSAGRVAVSERNLQKVSGIGSSSLAETDPEFVAIRDRLVYGEIMEQGSLNDSQRALVTLAVLAACQTLEDFDFHVNAALRAGASPVEIREALYQCAPYIGFPRTEAALKLANGVFRERNIALPLEKRGTVTEESRYRDGLAVQKSIFGNAIDEMHRATPADQKAIMQNYLSSFCFGDLYTREGLDLKMKELLTFAAISALGGCDSQVRSHVQGNLSVGNSRENLIDVLAQSLPYIGFPRTLNALACVNAVAGNAVSKP